MTSSKTKTSPVQKQSKSVADNASSKGKSMPAAQLKAKEKKAPAKK